MNIDRLKPNWGLITLIDKLAISYLEKMELIKADYEHGGFEIVEYPIQDSFKYSLSLYKDKENEGKHLDIYVHEGNIIYISLMNNQ